MEIQNLRLENVETDEGVIELYGGDVGHRPPLASYEGAWAAESGRNFPLLEILLEMRPSKQICGIDTAIPDFRNQAP